MLNRRNPDEDIRRLERDAYSGDSDALNKLVIKYKRLGIFMPHDLAVIVVQNKLDQLGSARELDEEISFTQLGLLTIDALSLNVSLFTDSELVEHYGGIPTNAREWFFLPTLAEFKTLRANQNSGLFLRGSTWSSTLLLVYEDGPDHYERIYPVNETRGMLPRFIKVDANNTYEDIMEKALNPSHMCYGTCFCTACRVHGCGCMQNLL